ncbi:MAG TPA: Asp-tRNA(Asn)/Glu-tRNA(Gln) amidotransferase subunit GatC [Vicinamibacterales bacterium]|nr:Asp-tRNA(Asn)/Glu-tRNA(Gln) amidotransferase subunit GatC [Vicinamibacterales bacterium]
MSAFTVDDVRRLAALARLELTPDETDAFARQLGDVLAFATEVERVDLTAATPANTVPGAMLEPQSAWREDTLQPSLDQTTVLAASADADRATGVFTVPRVLNG